MQEIELKGSNDVDVVLGGDENDVGDKSGALRRLSRVSSPPISPFLADWG